MLTQLYHSLGTRKKAEWEGTRTRRPRSLKLCGRGGGIPGPPFLKGQRMSPQEELQRVHSKTLAAWNVGAATSCPSCPLCSPLLLTRGIVLPWRPSGPRLVETHPAFSQGALRNSSLCPHKGPLCHSFPENNAPPRISPDCSHPHTCAFYSSSF